MEVSIAVTGFLQQVRFVFLPRRSSPTRERGPLLDFRSVGQEDAKDIEFIPGDVASCEMVQTAACGLSVRYKRNMSRKMAVNRSMVRLLFFSFYGFSFNPHRRAANNVPRDVHFASTLDRTTFIGSIRSRSTTLWCITNVPLGSLGYPYTGT